MEDFSLQSFSNFVSLHVVSILSPVEQLETQNKQLKVEKKETKRRKWKEIPHLMPPSFNKAPFW